MKKQKTKARVVGEYEQYAEIGELHATKWRKLDLMIPSNFRALCAILGVKVEDILYDFMWILSYSAVEKATPRQQAALREFFLLRQYGQPGYSKKQINKMFEELKAIRKIYDTTDGMKDSDRELFWKNYHMYGQYWYKRWFEKNSRKEEPSVLEKY